MLPHEISVPYYRYMFKYESGRQFRSYQGNGYGLFIIANNNRRNDNKWGDDL